MYNNTLVEHLKFPLHHVNYKCKVIQRNVGIFLHELRPGKCQTGEECWQPSVIKSLNNKIFLIPRKHIGRTAAGWCTSTTATSPVLTFSRTGYFLRWTQCRTKSFSGTGFSYSCTFASSSSAAAENTS